MFYLPATPSLRVEEVLTLIMKTDMRLFILNTSCKQLVFIQFM